MFFWFIGTAIVAVWAIFQDPRFDYRLLVVGAVVPLLDAVTGGVWVLHTLAFSLALMVAVMLTTVGRRPVRMILLGLPIGVMLHLVFDGAWTDADVFWWPLGGWGFGGEPLPEVARGWWNVPLEAAGIGLLVWAWRRRLLPRTSDDRCGTLAPVLILVRHGRTALNAAGRLQGRVDEPLDEIGRRQAIAVAERVGAVDELVSSPLRRARETADAFGVAYTVDERWIELAYGIYEGVPHADVPSEAWRQWRVDPSFVPEGGESLAGLDERVRAACDELAGRADGRTIAVVSHVSPIKCAVAWALGAGIDIGWRSHLSPASICRIDLRPSGPVLLSFNEVDPASPAP